MLNRHQAVLGFLLATAFWAIVLVLQSDPSAHYQICETNQYTEHETCASHHLLYVAFWYVGYVINPTSITALATVAIAWYAVKNSDAVAAKVSNTNTEADKLAIWEKARQGAVYTLDDTIRMNSRNRATRAVTCSGLLYVTVAETTAQKEVSRTDCGWEDVRFSQSVSILSLPPILTSARQCVISGVTSTPDEYNDILDKITTAYHLQLRFEHQPERVQILWQSWWA
jgi:hypothetical protein